MATYAIGDVQGCFTPLLELLKLIAFNPKEDRLIFCGDLVNRGGQSLDVLRWVFAHQNCCESVLGNHDLSLLSKFYTGRTNTANLEFKQIFQAADAPLILNWLLHRPFFLQIENDLIIHAGLYPYWKVKKFKRKAIETQQKLLADPAKFFKTMYGNTPKKWTKSLSPEAQSRFLVNASTRMRFVKSDGSLNFSENGKLTVVKNLLPWFQFAAIKSIKKHIIFGHWSALGYYHDEHVTCLDTGRVWGGKLTALRLEDRQIFTV